VTIGRTTYDLPDPFFTIATQNPIEQEGTYPLPEAQLDRFMFNIKVGYPSADEEEQILSVTTRNEKIEVNKVLSARAIVNLQKLVSSVAVSEYVVKYVARIVRATRPRDETAPEFVRELVDWGAGPRAGQFLINGGKALAAMDGRFSVAIDDVKKIAVPVLRHRLSTNFQAQAEGMTTEDIVLRLMKEIPEPEIPKFAGQAAGTAGVAATGGSRTSATTSAQVPRSDGSGSGVIGTAPQAPPQQSPPQPPPPPRTAPAGPTRSG
jgi:MoxR-like ATPase